MRIEQTKWTAQTGWSALAAASVGRSAQLVLVFSAPDVLRQTGVVQSLRERYPSAFILGCSTAGEICGTEVSDDTLVATAVHFEQTRLWSATVNLHEAGTSIRAGEMLAQALPHNFNGTPDDRLAHVLVLSDGL